MEQIHKLLSSFKRARSVELSSNPRDAFHMLFALIVHNQYKALQEVLSSPSGRQFDINHKSGRASNTLLMVAANCGSYDCLTTLLKFGADPNIQDMSGQTAILIACRSRHKKSVTKLIESGASISVPDKSGLTTLHWVAGNGSVDLITELTVNGKIPLDIEDTQRQTPLHMAAINGQNSAIVRLLDMGADINRANSDGATPLFLASKKNQNQVIDTLLTRGAKYSGNSSGQTPLDWVIENNSYHCLNIYLKHKPELLTDIVKGIEEKKVSDQKFSELVTLFQQVSNENDLVFLSFVDILCTRSHSCGMQLLTQQSNYEEFSNRLIRLVTCTCAILDAVGPAYVSKSLELSQRRNSGKKSDLGMKSGELKFQPETVFSRLEMVWTTMESWFQLFQDEISALDAYKSRNEFMRDLPDLDNAINCDESNMASKGTTNINSCSCSNDAKYPDIATDSSDFVEKVASCSTQQNKIDLLMILKGNEESLIKNTLTSNADTHEYNGVESENKENSMKDIISNFADKLCATLHAFALCLNCVYKLRRGLVSTGHEIDGVSPEVVHFLNQYRSVIRMLVNRKPCIIFEHFSFMLSSKQLIDQFLDVVRYEPFETRKDWFYDNLYKMNNQNQPTSSLYSEENPIHVDRSNFFGTSCTSILSAPSSTLKKDINIQFSGELGVGDGVKREWFDLLSTEFLNPDYVLFTPSADGSIFQPNPNSSINPDHLSYFRFAGRAFGLALYHKHLIPVYFTRSFYKHILDKPLDLEDVASIDPDYAKNLKWLLDTAIDEAQLEITFSVEEEAFGDIVQIELKPGGSKLPVTDANKSEYVHLVADHRMTRAIRDQIYHFLEGLHEFIPHSLLSLFNEYELELLMSGVPEIDLQDWKAHSDYSGLESSDPLVIWFWEYLHSLDKKSLALLLQFVTGSTRVPFGGFASLQGGGGLNKFKITKISYTSGCLPQASTCFNLLKLPDYSTKRELKTKFDIILKHGTTGFEFK